MKRFACAILFVMMIFLAGCSVNTGVYTEYKETSDGVRYRESDGEAVYFPETIPVRMELGEIEFTLEDYYIGETDTGIGYSDIIQIEFSYHPDVSKKDRYWFLRDDFKAFVYVKDEARDIDESYMLYDSPINDTLGIEFQEYGDRIYFTCIIQANGRYSVEDSELSFILEYSTDERTDRYNLDTKVEESHMAKFDNSDHCVFVGSDALSFISRKAKAIDGQSE